MKISLSVTHDCNLRCTYCYTGEKSSRIMEMETAEKIIDFVFIITPPEESINFGFFGGEPLLQLSFLKEVIAYIHSKNSSNPISFSLTTNGTLLNDMAIQFIRDYNIQLTVSIDGSEEVHNKNRIDKHGRGTLPSVLSNIETMSKEIDYFQVNAVYTPETISELDQTVRFLIDNNMFNIHLNPDIVSYWDEKSFTKIAEVYKKVADTYIEMFNSGREVAINLLDSKLILFFKGGYERSDKCGMGETEFGFAPSGNVYPCERLVGDDSDEQMLMGNIYTGVNLFKRCSIGKRSDNTNKECSECSVQKYCMNWCGCTNYHMTGFPDKASAMLCHSERHAIGAAKYAFEALQSNSLFLNHMLTYAHHNQ